MSDTSPEPKSSGPVAPSNDGSPDPVQAGQSANSESVRSPTQLVHVAAAVHAAVGVVTLPLVRLAPAKATPTAMTPTPTMIQKGQRRSAAEPVAKKPVRNQARNANKATSAQPRRLPSKSTEEKPHIGDSRPAPAAESETGSDDKSPS